MYCENTNNHFPTSTRVVDLVLVGRRWVTILCVCGGWGGGGGGQGEYTSTAQNPKVLRKQV